MCKFYAHPDSFQPFVLRQPLSNVPRAEIPLVINSLNLVLFADGGFQDEFVV